MIHTPLDPLFLCRLVIPHLTSNPLGCNLLSQFYYIRTITTCTILNNNDVSLTSSKCCFHEKITFVQFVVEKWLIGSGCRLEWWVSWVQGWSSQMGLAIALWEGVQNMHHWSQRPQTSHQNWLGQAASRHHCFSCASVASTSFSLCERGGGHFEHCF